MNSLPKAHYRLFVCDRYVLPVDYTHSPACSLFRVVLPRRPMGPPLPQSIPLSLLPCQWLCVALCLRCDVVLICRGTNLEREFLCLSEKCSSRATEEQSAGDGPWICMYANVSEVFCAGEGKRHVPEARQRAKQSSKRGYDENGKRLETQMTMKHSRESNVWEARRSLQGQDRDTAAGNCILI